MPFKWSSRIRTVINGVRIHYGGGINCKDTQRSYLGWWNLHLNSGGDYMGVYISKKSKIAHLGSVCISMYLNLSQFLKIK